jgi:hypothetical protein
MAKLGWFMSKCHMTELRWPMSKCHGIGPINQGLTLMTTHKTINYTLVARAPYKKPLKKRLNQTTQSPI